MEAALCRENSSNSSADDADCLQHTGVGDCSDGSCSAQKPAELADILAAITKQVEFYFSDANLPTDKHLLKQIQKDPEGYVPVRMIANFKRVKALTKDMAVVVEALQGSSLLSLDESATRVRRSTPLPAFDVDDICRRTVVVEHLPVKPTIESVTQLLSQYGEVAMVRICSRGSTNKLPAWLSKAVDAINMTMAPGEFALVEYGSEDDCMECISRTKNPDNWRTSLRVRHLLPNFKPSHISSARSPSCGGMTRGDGKQPGRETSSGGSCDKQHQQSSTVNRSTQDGHGRRTPHDHHHHETQQQSPHTKEELAAAEAAAVAVTAMPSLAPIKTSTAQPAAQGAASPPANGSAPVFDVLGSPAGLSPIKAPSVSASIAAGVGGSIGSPRTVSSPAPPEVSSYIDSILSAPTGNTPTKAGSSNGGRWSGAGDWSSSSVTPAAAVAAALAGVSTPPQSSSPRHSATGGSNRLSVGASGTGTPTRLSATTSNAAQLAPTQSALAAQLAAAAAAAAQAAMAGSPKVAHGSNAASWRSPQVPAAGAAAGPGVSVSAPTTPLAGLTAGDAVGAALDEQLGSLAVPSRPLTVGSPDLASSPKPGPWIPASRMQHMQQAAAEGHHRVRSSGSEAEDNGGRWKRSSWTGQAGSSSGSGMKPPKPRVSGSGQASHSSRQRRPSWHAADDEVAGRMDGVASGSGVDSSDGASADVLHARNRRSRLQQASGDYAGSVEVPVTGDKDADMLAAAQAIATLSIGGMQHQRRRSSNTGAGEARDDGDDEHDADELGAEGSSSGKSRRRRRKRSGTGSRRASLDEGGGSRRTSIDGAGGVSGSGSHKAGTATPDDAVGHNRSSSGSNKQHSGAAEHQRRGSHDGAAKDKEGKKKEKKDYASWAAATPEFRAVSAAKHSSGGSTSAGGASGPGVLGTSPGRAGQAGISPLRASAGGAAGTGHDGDSHVRIARMPDGTRGFGMGRGRVMSPAP